MVSDYDARPQMIQSEILTYYLEEPLVNIVRHSVYSENKEEDDDYPIAFVSDDDYTGHGYGDESNKKPLDYNSFVEQYDIPNRRKMYEDRKKVEVPETNYNYRYLLNDRKSDSDGSYEDDSVLKTEYDEDKDQTDELESYYEYDEKNSANGQAYFNSNYGGHVYNNDYSEYSDTTSAPEEVIPSVDKQEIEEKDVQNIEETDTLNSGVVGGPYVLPQPTTIAHNQMSAPVNEKTVVAFEDVVGAEVNEDIELSTGSHLTFSTPRKHHEKNFVRQPTSGASHSVEYGLSLPIFYMLSIIIMIYLT